MAFLAALAPIMGSLGTAATIAGTAVSAIGTLAAGSQAAAQGKAAQTAANYEAAQLDAKGKEEQAAAQQEAEQYRRNKELAKSTLQTRGAASGFSATDPSTLARAGEIERYGTLQEQLAMFGGTSRREGLEAAARAERYSGATALAAGRAKRTASYFDAGSTILGGMSTLAGKYDTKFDSRGYDYRYSAENSDTWRRNQTVTRYR